MKKYLVTFFMALTVAGVANANDQVNDGLVWGCKLKNVEIIKGKTKQVPVLGLLYSTRFAGEGELSCLSVLKNQIARTPVKVILKAKGIGLGTAFPKKVAMVSLGAGLKVNSPEDLFGDYSAGLKVSGTLLTVTGGVGIKFQNPAGGPAMDLALLGEEAIGFKLSADVFSLKVIPAGETKVEYLNR